MIKDLQTENSLYLDSLLEEKISDDSLKKEHRDKQKKTNQVFAYSGASKRKFVIEQSNWGASREKRRDANYEVGAQQGPRRDKFRDAAGKYWGYDDHKGSSVVFVSEGSTPSRKLRVPFEMWTSEPKYFYSQEGLPSGRNPFFEVRQVVRIRPDKRAFSTSHPKNVYQPHRWRKLIEGFQGQNVSNATGIIDEHVEYDYLAFDMNMPFNYRQLDDLNIAGPHYAKIRPEYNFYIKDYEEMIRFGDGLNQPEPVFPNLYALMTEKNSEISNPIFTNHINLGGTLTDNEATIGASNKDKFSIKKHAGQYFDLYGRQFSKAVDPNEGVPGKVKAIGQKFRNVIVPADNVGLLREMSSKKELFPMFVEMEFSTDKMTEFAQMLSDTMMTNDFMWSVVKDVISSSGFETRSFMEVVETVRTLIQEDGTTVVKKNTQTLQAQRRVWDVAEWIKNSSLVDFDTGEPKPSSETLASTLESLKKAVFLDDGSIMQNLTVPAKMKFFRSLLGVIFVGKLRTFLKSRFRTYDEIIEGHPCHTETVLYRVEKTLADENGDPSGETIQNFWFPNTNQIDVLNLVDTQVKYAKRYAYRIYAYQLVVNTKYHYVKQRVWDEAAAVLVSMRPEVLLIEQEVFVDDQLIMDDPPVPPEVEIIPYFGDSHKLLFNLKSAVGEYHLDPIVLNEEDGEQHTKSRLAQKIRADEPIRFKGDDSVGREGAFEIYRLDFHPQAWSDFDAQILAGVSNQIASTGEYVDVIGSNKKYYYTFRMVDSHGHVSNPTPVWEVELVDDEGSIYMKKRMVDFAPREPRHPSKKMRRLLQIQPAIEQTFIQDPDEEVESAFQVKNVALGRLQESPWGRKFKFRIVSKKTGKKLDVNVDFKSTLDRRKTLK